jgi:hypothetical protein
LLGGAIAYEQTPNRGRKSDAVTRGLDPIGANLSLATNLSVVMHRFKRGTQ